MPPDRQRLRRRERRQRGMPTRRGWRRRNSTTRKAHKTTGTQRGTTRERNRAMPEQHQSDDGAEQTGCHEDHCHSGLNSVTTSANVRPVGGVARHREVCQADAAEHGVPEAAHDGEGSASRWRAEAIFSGHHGSMATAATMKGSCASTNASNETTPEAPAASHAGKTFRRVGAELRLCQNRDGGQQGGDDQAGRARTDGQVWRSSDPPWVGCDLDARNQTSHPASVRWSSRVSSRVVALSTSG